MIIVYQWYVIFTFTLFLVSYLFHYVQFLVLLFLYVSNFFHVSDDFVLRRLFSVI